MDPKPSSRNRYGVTVRRIWCLAVVCIIFGVALPLHGYAQQVLTIAKVDHNDVTDDVAREVLTSAYRKLGITLVLKELPAARALAESSEGAVDGEFQRRDGLSSMYPNLVQVMVPINWLDICVFTRDVNFKPHGWESLRPYRIGYHHGILAIEEGTKGMNVDPADTNELVLRKLLAGRTDIAVMTSIDGQLLIHDMNEKSIHMLSPPIVHLQLYHYLNKKNAGVAVRLEKVLRAMAADGSIAAIRQRVLVNAGVYLNNE